MYLLVRGGSPQVAFLAASRHALGPQKCARRFPTNIIVLAFQIRQLATQVWSDLAFVLSLLHLLQLVLEIPLLVNEGSSQLGCLLKPTLSLSQVSLKGSLGLSWRSRIQAEQLGVER